MKKIIFTIIRSIFAILAVILAGFLVAPMGQGIINIGNIMGTALCVWIFCVSVAPIHRAIRKFFCRHKFTKFLYRFVNVCFIIPIITKPPPKVHELITKIFLNNCQ